MQPAFRLAVSLGAAVTVMTAAWIGMPISTTHALTGGLVGAGLVAAASEVQFVSLGKAFVLPLLFSPVVALTVLLYPLFRWARRSFGITSQTCVCSSHPRMVIYHCQYRAFSRASASSEGRSRREYSPPPSTAPTIGARI